MERRGHQTTLLQSTTDPKFAAGARCGLRSAVLLGAHRLHGGRRGAARGRRADGRGSPGELVGGSEAPAPLPLLPGPLACKRRRGSAAIWRRAALDLRTRHWRTRAICSTLDFCRKFDLA